MKVLLCNSPGTAQGAFSNPPVGLLMIGAALELDGHQVRLADGYLDGWPGIDEGLAWGPDVVGTTVYTPGRHQALECCRRAKAAGAVAVLGGPHATIMWRQLMEHYPEVDLCVLGEGEQTIREVAAGRPWDEVPGIAYRDVGGKVVQTTRREYVTDLDSLPFPAWHLAEPLSRYPGGSGVHEVRGHTIHLGQVRVPIVGSRGCTGSCTFCLPEGTSISLTDGGMQNIESLSPGNRVSSLHGQGTVTERMTRLARDFVRIETLSGRVLTMTPEHPVLTRNRGWTPAGELQEGDDLIEINDR